MNARERRFLLIGLAALMLGVVIASVVSVGVRRPRAGELLPCGDPSRTVFELGGVTKAVCVKGHAWTRVGGKWVGGVDVPSIP